MKVLLATVGSRGDVAPMLVLARALRERGHEPRVAAPPNFQQFVQDAGLGFFPIGADTELIIQENRALAERSPLVAIPSQIALLRRETERQMRELLGYAAGADRVVAAGLSFGARSLADRLGVPYTFVCYTLAGIPAADHPPAAIPIFGLPRAANRALWWGITRTFDLALQSPFDGARRAHGLEREPAPWQSVHASNTLLAQDAVLGVLPQAAKAFCHQVPALVPLAESHAELPQSGELPEQVERFLGPARAPNAARPGPPVVYVGFGSMPTVDRERLVRSILEFQRVSGVRVLLYSAYAEEAQRELPASVLAIGALDHVRLFPRVDLIVHHGGAGTTATALRAGVPQLIVPHIVDQFFHGRRIHELGLGPAPIPKAKLDAPALLDAYNQSRSCQDRARVIATELGRTSGAHAAAEYIERLGGPG